MKRLSVKKSNCVTSIFEKSASWQVTRVTVRVFSYETLQGSLFQRKLVNFVIEKFPKQQKNERKLRIERNSKAWLEGWILNIQSCVAHGSWCSPGRELKQCATAGAADISPVIEWSCALNVWMQEPMNVIAKHVSNGLATFVLPAPHWNVLFP